MYDNDTHAIRNVPADAFSGVYTVAGGDTIEGGVVYEIVRDGAVIDVCAKKPAVIPEGAVCTPVAAITIDGKTYAISYEVVSEAERRTLKLLDSARAKLTPEEFDAVRGSKR